MSENEMNENELRERISDIIDEESGEYGEEEGEKSPVPMDTPQRVKKGKKVKKKLSEEHLNKMREGKKKWLEKKRLEKVEKKKPPGKSKKVVVNNYYIESEEEEEEEEEEVVNNYIKKAPRKQKKGKRLLE